jgi:DNA-binding transcriptional ArsR family regulator
MNRALAKTADGIDRIIHEPARLMIVSLLAKAKEADFTTILRHTGLTRGNLSTHLARLEGAGYVTANKGFRGKIPQTTFCLTDTGRAAFAAYRRQLRHYL